MDNFKKVLLKPNIEPLDSNSQRIRRNLVVTSVVAFFLSIGSSGIDPKNSSFVGIKFNEVRVEIIQIMIVLALIYFFIHFLWASLDHFKENKLRLTGIVMPMIRGNSFDPNTHEESQSTMHSWWTSEMDLTKEYRKLLTDMKKHAIKDQQESVIGLMTLRMDELEGKSAYIYEALKSYETSFWYHQRSQLLRWIILDFSIPLIIGFVSLILLLIRLLPSIQMYFSA